MGSVCSSMDDVGQPRSEVAGTESKGSVYVTAYNNNTNTGCAVPETSSPDENSSNATRLDENNPPHPPPSKEGLETGERSGAGLETKSSEPPDLLKENSSKREDVTPAVEVKDIDLDKSNTDMELADDGIRNNNNNNDDDGSRTAPGSTNGDDQMDVGVRHCQRVDEDGDDSGLEEDDSPSYNVGPVTEAATMASIGELAITKPAPDFEVNALVDGSFKVVKLSSYRGKYLVLFFYPLDFTFVCPTEIIAFSDRIEEFRAINCEVVACSTDSVYSHLAWCETPRKQGGLGPMKIPLLADRNQELSKKYGCLKADEGIAFRGLYIIDPKGNLRQMTINDLPVGRSVDETLRLVQAFQFTDTHGEVCPAGWKPGKDTMKPDPKEKNKYFSKQ